MADFSQLVQKAFYLGVGLASYATEKAGDGFSDLRQQAQKLVNELVERGEITAEEAQKMVNDMVDRAQSAAPSAASKPPAESGPRKIEIIEDDEPDDRAATDALRQEIEELQAELQRLKEEDS
ncbi:hypothetical protein N836_29265 [Leptolyngbya sp. Heron Island J]|uniref:phasin family protein n=1 Tax=Leptolyngbya sp. Heron Island J TaxID=1385935 RepID=UPI0003B9E9E3|nr:hypothetical protein [Leptolyngbya sp. Heron Island J]ESA39045.1 hypothetical protein N836_29265 [Leptolyngbya sp. Heron Island J]